MYEEFRRRLVLSYAIRIVEVAPNPTPMCRSWKTSMKDLSIELVFCLYNSFAARFHQGCSTGLEFYGTVSVLSHGLAELS